MQFFASHGFKILTPLEKPKQRNGYYASMVPSVPRAHARLMTVCPSRSATRMALPGRLRAFA